MGRFGKDARHPADNGRTQEGLVELIVLNVGLNAGVINTKVFTIMVMMALVTTFMTCVFSDANRICQ